ncbi:hypothetical protein RJT34_06880 [Clitoria ternatea]|uniref:Translation elongation factor IF5A C-terminal domain-containing protein n=1 Tax=Clitoria ternatea TaxID=43366 RepID=A0AAN9PTS0_CLITE
MSDEEHHFESKADAGASKTFPQQAGTIRKNGYIVIKNRPCKVVEVSTSKTGKHGHAKCHFVGIDIFTGKKLEDIVPSSHNCDVPHVNRTDYQLIDISEDGFVSLLTESGGTKDDLRLPTDESLLSQIKDGFAEGKDLVVSVMSSMGEEQINALKDIGPNVGNVSSGSGLVHVDVIVLGEVHYLSDISLGTVWEEIVIYCPKEVQLICLSATVANPDELAGWIRQIHGETELVTSSKRPVPLTWHFSMKNSLLPLLNEKGTQMNRIVSTAVYHVCAGGLVQHLVWQIDVGDDDIARDWAKSYKDDWSRKRNSRKRGTHKSYDSDDGIFEQGSLLKNNINAIRRSQVPQVTDTLWQLQARDMLPAIWFIFSRKGCDAAVQYLENCKLLDECETSEVELALKRFRKQYPDAVRETAVTGLLQGVAAHHAGCLPLWKTFIEELFQRGLVKVVFATETLAAGINMPARTAVISSLSKRGDIGRIPLSSNELLQMAGRAGRRGIDESGHVVLIQTPNEGAEEGCKVPFAGLEPLVSQFTASYGMVLNLLAGVKATHMSNELDDMRPFTGRTLEEARKLVEQSFGNYVSSNVMPAAKEELKRIEKEIELLMSETTDEAIDKKCRKALSKQQYKEIAELQEKDLRAEKCIRTELRKQMEAKRISSLKSLLEEPESGHLPFLCLQCRDTEGVQHSIPAVLLGKVDSLNASKLQNMISSVDSFALNLADAEPSVIDSELSEDCEPSYHVALGSDNSWYLFTGKWIKTVYGTGFPNVPLAQGDARPWEIMSVLIDKEDMKWDKLAHSEQGGLWFTEGCLETWSWSLNVPVLSSLSENDDLLLKSQEKHGVTISCGMVEAWASGLTWREIMMDCAMDDGDLARLLRRTIDLLVQIPKLPDIDPLLQRNAKAASDIMDRPPISELAG